MIKTNIHVDIYDKDQFNIKAEIGYLDDCDISIQTDESQVSLRLNELQAMRLYEKLNELYSIEENDKDAIVNLKVKKGKVTWFNAEKGYGFITSDNGNSYFVHWSNIECDGFKMLYEEDNVEFTIGKGTRGLEAKSVKKINK